MTTSYANFSQSISKIILFLTILAVHHDRMNILHVYQEIVSINNISVIQADCSQTTHFAQDLGAKVRMQSEVRGSDFIRLIYDSIFKHLDYLYNKTKGIKFQEIGIRSHGSKKNLGKILRRLFTPLKQCCLCCLHQFLCPCTVKIISKISYIAMKFHFK